MQKYYILKDKDTNKKYEFETRKELLLFLYSSKNISNYSVKEEWKGISI